MSGRGGREAENKINKHMYQGMQSTSKTIFKTNGRYDRQIEILNFPKIVEQATVIFIFCLILRSWMFCLRFENKLQAASLFLEFSDNLSRGGPTKSDVKRILKR